MSCFLFTQIAVLIKLWTFPTLILFIFCFSTYRVRHKKQSPRKTQISREWHNLNYWNLAYLLPRDIVRDSENFFHIFGRKQKLQLSKMKSAILQLNTHYYHDCYTENADKTNCVELIWKDEYPPNSSDLNPLEYHIWDAMLDMYHSKADQHLWGEERCASDLSWLVSRPKLIQQYCCSAKGSRHAKSSWWIFRTCCLNRCSALL